jgi:predicted nucleic acid-binding Zn ribbon protein
MSINCPNCNHPVRKDARYCGFCGTDLMPPAEVKPAAPPAKSQKAGSNQTSIAQKKSKPKRFQTSQVVTFVAIILLFVVIILSVVCRYWSEISQGLIQLIFSMYVRFALL